MNLFFGKRRNRDWVWLLGIFILGLVFMLVMGTLAISQPPEWTVKASMDSLIDPNAEYAAIRSTKPVIAPVRADILTQPVWQDVYLTPSSPTPTRRSNDNTDPTATSKPVDNTPSLSTSTPVSSPAVTGTIASRATGTSTARPTASKTFIIFFPSSTPKPKTATPKRPNTLTYTPTTALTGTRTSTPTKTATFTRTATFTKTLTPTRTLTPTKTFTPTVTSTPTITLTPTLTNTPTVTATYTETLTPTITLTPTVTPTPTITPTVDPFNYGSPDGDVYSPGDGSVLVLTLPIPVTDHGDLGYDFVYYERSTGPNQIDMDRVIIEISQDGSTWFEVFNWGNGVADTNSNLDISVLGGGEADNRTINTGLFNGTGVTVDIFSLGLTGSYGYMRITAVPGGGDGIDIDSIDIVP